MSTSVPSTTSISEKKSFSLALNALTAFSKNEVKETSTLSTIPLVTVLPLKRVLSSNNFSNILEDKQISVTISSHMSSTESSDSEDSDAGSISSASAGAGTAIHKIQPFSIKRRRIVQETPLNSIPYCIPSEESLTFSAAKCRFHKCNEVSTKNAPFCARHTGIKTCSFSGCNKCAQGSTNFCISHGGGRRCKVDGCLKGARDRNFCANHGGGKRCKETGCNKSAVGGTNMCTSHGGGKKCNFDSCTKSAQSPTGFCVRHGGGRKCKMEMCAKVARGRTLFCSSHNSATNGLNFEDRVVEMEKEILSRLIHLHKEAYPQSV